MSGLDELRREYATRRSLANRLGELRPPRHPRAGAALDTLLVTTHGPAIAIGGGPQRVHPRLRNLNLAPFPNVDLVGDAHRLPLADASVAALHCEAVLEHLDQPQVAVAEMLRVLRPGGLVFAATPFLQSFHGYPSHHRNFTLMGHRGLFERAGFEILDSGPCVGPTFALVDLASNWARELLPGRWLSRGAWLLIRLAGRLLVPLDHLLLRNERAHRLASTTFVLARKPLGAVPP